MTPEEIWARIEPRLLSVQRPARYVGGEHNEIVKPWPDMPTRVALLFPDIYDIGLANLGLAILYDIINSQPDMLAERVYSPWSDMEELLGATGVPLFSLESKRALVDFDLIGVSLAYETLYSNTINALALGGVPLRTADRGADDPVVIAGGHATFNPEPMAQFFDAFVIGDGEEAILEVARCVAAWKGSAKRTRRDLHRQLARIWGVYVPSLYRITYDERGAVADIEPLAPEASLPVKKRIVARLPPPPTRFIVPHLEVVHDRAVIEIMRGCSRGCRFCQAGMLTRPVRERPVNEVVEAIRASLAATGFQEVGLLSLSSSDYSNVLELVQAVSREFSSDQRLNISLPSMRIESFSVELMNALQKGARRGGFTLAPEAATESMRAMINKPIDADAVVETARAIYGRGWHTIKLYFMVGHPDETEADVMAISELVRAVHAVGRKQLGGRARVNVGVSTFVPKPHTPFQWVPLAESSRIAEHQQLLKGALRDRAIKLSWNDAAETMLEACLGRGDRRLGPVIEQAWRNGARFDAWQEHCDFDRWSQAFASCELDPNDFARRPRDLEERLPWDHIQAVDKRFLVADYQQALQGNTRVDCRQKCHACGILPDFKQLRVENPGPVWKCPEIEPKEVDDG